MMRARVLVCAVVAAIALAAAPGIARANTVSASCTLTDLTPVACGAWQAADVTLRWSWSPSGETSTDGCGTTTFTSDTPSPGDSRTCTVHWGGMFAGSSATVSVDKTSPVVTSATPDRPPDYDGWYNHPVALGFGGTDTPSGIAACDTVTYGGPDSGAASVSGSCRDRAGNGASASFPLKYDATPPAPPQIQAAPGDGSIRLSWVTSGDTASVRITRASTLIYTGTGGGLTDGSLQNGATYRYTVTELDQAGNTASASIDATPTALSLRPLPGALAAKPPLLRWKKLRKARYYNVQVFRGRRKILSAWPTAGQLQLKRSWRYRGHRYRLTPGLYRWYVWPGYGARAAHRYGKMLGKSSFRVS